MDTDLNKHRDTDGWLTAISTTSYSKEKGKARKNKYQINFNVFNIPLEKMFPDVATSLIEKDSVPTKEREAVAPLEFVMGTKFTCRVCACEFSTLREQHDHFKTPLHVVNLKRSMLAWSQ